MSNYRWNNFHGYFPGGFYRVLCSDESRKLIEDLDRTLMEPNFDMQSFNRLMEKVHAYSDEKAAMIDKIRRENRRELMAEEQQRSGEIQKLSAEAYGELDVLLEPVVKRMMELGYSLEQLIG